MKSTSISWIDEKSVKHHGEILETCGNFKVIECEWCKFKHVVPLPSLEELKTVYSHEYYTREKPFYIKRYLEDKEWWDRVYTERFMRLESYLPPERRRLLDVGSGPGLFLALGRSRGWSVKGIEPSKKAALYSRETLGLDVEEIFLTRENASQLGRFDVVNMGEVLEHLPDPLDMLEIVHSILAESGLLCLIVPNDFNPLQEILRCHLDFNPWWVAPPHHLNYFNKTSICSLIKKKCFELVHIETSFPLELFLLMGFDYVNSPTIGKKIHNYRKNLEMNMWNADAGKLKDNIYRSLSEVGLGREIVLFAKKNTR